MNVCIALSAKFCRWSCAVTIWYLSFSFLLLLWDHQRFCYPICVIQVWYLPLVVHHSIICIRVLIPMQLLIWLDVLICCLNQSCIRRTYIFSLHLIQTEILLVYLYRLNLWVSCIQWFHKLRDDILLAINVEVLIQNCQFVVAIIIIIILLFIILGFCYWYCTLPYCLHMNNSCYYLFWNMLPYPLWSFEFVELWPCCIISFFLLPWTRFQLLYYLHMHANILQGIVPFFGYRR